MAAELCVLLSAHIPDPHGPVAAAHDYALAVRREGHATHRGLMALQFKACLQRLLLEIVEAHCAVQGSRGEEVPVGGEANGAHCLQVTHQDLLHGTPRGTPHTHGVVRGRAGKTAAAVRCPGHAVDPVGVATEDLGLPRARYSTLLHVPKTDVGVPATRSKLRRVCREGHRSHGVEVALQLGLAAAIRISPKPHRLVGAG
mmetsp:Transcript_110866/g.236794  ORF Transcript_110866/g.236794 Transcript_110866/m.236794 type:complete len:200 (-) Transcript_110866:506-1105(-)